MFAFFIYITYIYFHLFIFDFSFHFFKDPNNTEVEKEDGDEYDATSNYEWQNRVDDDIVHLDIINDGYVSWQSGQSSTVEYLEQNSDVETQYSEYNDNNNEVDSNIDYNESYNASEDTKNNRTAEVYESVMYNVGVHGNNEGVASRKDKESRSSSIRPVAFNFQDREPNVTNQQSIRNPVDTYICPSAIRSLETNSSRQRPPLKAPPVKRQMTSYAPTTNLSSAIPVSTQAQTTQSSVKQVSIRGQTNKTSTKQVLSQGQTSLSTAEEVITPAHTTLSYVKQPTQAQTSQSSQASAKQVITQTQASQPITRQAAMRSTNPFAQKWA